MSYPQARQIKNILVGVGKLEINDTAGDGGLTAGSLDTQILAFDPTQFNDLGFTSNGVEISFQPDLVDIKVDQLGDAAKLVEQSTKVSIKTTLAEATLNNMAVAMGFASAAVVNGTTAPTSANITSGTSFTTLQLGVNSSAVPVERSLRFTGLSPAGLPRVYVCTRVVSMSASAHSYKRGEATMYPVEFRVLPDAALTGQEYGFVVDRMA